MSRPRRPSARAGVLLALFGLLAALALAEVALRLLPPRERKLHVVSDPVFHHRFRPHARAKVAGYEYVINGHGFRDREIAVPKPPGVFRVLVLGDSFTEGWGLAFEDTMPKRVEAMLGAAACRRAVEVINAGVGSYSPILEYLLLQRVGLALEPDLVVLNFDMTDVNDDWIRTQLARLDGHGLPIAVPADPRRETALALLPVSRLTATTMLAPVERALDRLVLVQLLQRSKLGRAVVGGLDRSPERLEARGLVGDIQYDNEAITRDIESPSVREAWRHTERYLAGIHGLARSRNLPFALVVYPHAQQVAADESPIGRRRHGLGPGFFGSRRPFERLAALGRREGFPVIDLQALFQARHAAERPLFRPEDIHHTPAGARLFAEGVTAGLLERGLVPCRRGGGRIR